MAQYIDKDALVAEIDDMLKTKEHTSHCDEASFNSGRWKALTSIKNFLDTLEVKEVDLDESARNYLLYEHISPLSKVLHQADLKVEMQYHKDIEDTYKAGFELGLKAQKR